MAVLGSGRHEEGGGLPAPFAADVQTLARGGGVQIAGQITSRGLAMFFTFILSALLSVPGYGLYRKVAQILHIAGQLGLAGFNYAAMHFISRARAAGDHARVRGTARLALRAAATVSTLAAVALFLAAEPLARVFSGPGGDVGELATLIRVGAPFVLFFALMQVLRYCTQAYRTMVPSVLVGNIIQPAVRFVLGVVVLVAGMGVAAVVVGEVASLVVGVVAGSFFFRRMLTEEERSAVPSAEVAPIVRFALPQGGSSLLGIQALGLGIIILAAFEGNREVGLFGIALALQGPGGIFLGGIVNIWAPIVSELYQKREIERLGSLYQTITRWVATFSFPVFAALILEPGLFLLPFPADAEGAAPVVAILAAGNLFYTGTGPSGYVLSMSGRPGVNFLNSLVGVALYVGLGILVVPTYGVIGMAVVDAAVTAVINTARVVEARLLVGVQPFGRSFMKPLGATLAGAATLLLWRLLPGNGYILRAAGVVVAAAVYVLTLRRLGLDAEERYVWERIRNRALKGRRRRGTP